MNSLILTYVFLYTYINVIKNLQRVSLDVSIH